jgi:penicillin V acylase-like amidase (Ntn superfamily)
MGDTAVDMIHVFPRGRTANPPNSITWVAKYGFVGICGNPDPFVQDAKDNVYDGLNEAGLSCASLSIDGTGSQYPPPTADPQGNLAAPFFCRFVLENFANVEEVKLGLAGLSVYRSADWASMQEHFYMTDDDGRNLAVEFVNGQMAVHLDLNDAETGFGILTNAPTFPWQVETIKHYNWKVGRGNPAIAIPGGFYPDDRFLRVHILRSAIEERWQPTTYRQAVALTISVLNAVAVPPGSPPSVDYKFDHTKWQWVRDHKNRRVYYRACNSPSFQMIDLKKLSLTAGGEVTSLGTEVEADDKWYRDVTSNVAPRPKAEFAMV